MSTKLSAMAKLSRKQWLTFTVFSVADLCSAICFSIQAPFYPEEAAGKGASPTQCGLVFGVYEATVFLVSPLLGKYLNKIGARNIFIGGVFITGFCTVLFGLLNQIHDTDVFVALSFIVRILQGAGNAGFLTASFSIIASEFPDRVATMFASLEAFFGLGLIVGPSVGASLFELGGFSLPFVSMGIMLLLSSCLAVFLLPEFQNYSGTELTGGKGIVDALKVPSVLLATLSVFAASISIGFLQATLEQHMHLQFHFTAMMVGVMFMINGGMYALSAPCWGWLCDNYVHPKVVIVAGSALVTIAFFLIGPAPILPMEPIYEVCVVGLVVHGVGFGAELVAGFVLAHKGALMAGFHDDLNTYGLISGLWTSIFALGACVGPSVAGLLIEKSNFRFASVFVIVIHAALFFIAIIFILTDLILFSKRRLYQILHGDDLENSRHSEGYSSADETLDDTPALPFLPFLGEHLASLTPTTNQCSTPIHLIGSKTTASNSVGSHSKKFMCSGGSPFIFPPSSRASFNPNEQQNDVVHIIPYTRD